MFVNICSLYGTKEPVWPTLRPPCGSMRSLSLLYDPDCEPPSQFMSGKTWSCNDGLNVGANACILPLGYGYCDKSSVAGMN